MDRLTENEYEKLLNGLKKDGNDRGYWILSGKDMGSGSFTREELLELLR